jgi:transposase InsO family protein
LTGPQPDACDGVEAWASAALGGQQPQVSGGAGLGAEAVRFRVPAPNRLCMADITAVWTLEGWLHLAAVLDLYDRPLVGPAMPGHMRTELPLAELDMGGARPRRPALGRLHHGERGSQYAPRPCRATLMNVLAIASEARP